MKILIFVTSLIWTLLSAISTGNSLRDGEREVAAITFTLWILSMIAAGYLLIEIVQTK